MLEVLKSLIAANFENDFKNRIQEYINDNEQIDNDILTAIAEELNNKYNELLKPIYNKYSSKYIYDNLKDFEIMSCIKPFIKFELYNKFYVNDDALFDALSDFVDDDLFDVIEI